MCDEAMVYCPASLKFIPVSFVTSIMHKYLDNALHVNDMYSIIMNIFIKSHLLLVKYIFLLQILIKLILI